LGRVALVAAAAAAFFVSASAANAGVVARPVGDGLVLRTAPAGPVLAHVGVRTKFGSPLALSVSARRGRWLGVITPLLPNGELAWIDSRAVRTSTISVRIDVSLSKRRLRLMQGPAVLAQITVGIGAARTPTPTGSFAVTDRLSGSSYGGVYGCCILALSAHQQRPSPAWRGSDTRVAIHGGALGAISNGCLHASTAALRLLMARVPLGTRVTIRP
jgi:lipoprotein-anchoring transpeptidase ErfK/SrfK